MQAETDHHLVLVKNKQKKLDELKNKLTRLIITIIIFDFIAFTLNGLGFVGGFTFNLTIPWLVTKIIMVLTIIVWTKSLSLASSPTSILYLRRFIDLTIVFNIFDSFIAVSEYRLMVPIAEVINNITLTISIFCLVIRFQIIYILKQISKIHIKIPI
jgi:hypothetical protein